MFPSDNQHYEKIGKTVKCIEDEIPFEIPESWAWCRLGSVGTFIRGSGIKRTETISEGIQCVRYGELYTTYTTSFEKTVSFVNEELANKSKQIQYGDALLTLTGENKQDIGKAVVFLGNERTVIGGDLIQYTNHCFEPLFLSYLLNSPYVVYQKSVASTGDIIVHLSGVKLSNLLVAFPPIKEQARIVEAIDKYLPLISKYDMYNISKSKMDSEIYPLLKKSLLQYAIQGKLVPQDPKDEPASVVLERIRAEKQQLIKEGKIKRDKNDSYIYRGSDNSYYEKFADDNEVCIDEEIPFAIPNSWCWCRLGSISTYAQPKQKTNAQNANSNIWGLDLEDIEKGGKLLDIKTVGERKAKGDKTFFHKNDILYSKLRPYLLKVLIAHDNGICTPEIVPFSMYGSISNEYIVNCLKAPFIDSFINRITYGIKMPRVGTETMIKLLIPIPPLPEQKRICNILKQINNNN